MEAKIAARMNRMAPSGIRKVNEKTLAMKRAGEKVFHFEIGRPDFDTPEYIKKAACQALAKGKVHYISNFCLMELRQAIADKLKQENNIDYKASEILVTVGLSEAVFAVLATILEEGDEILVPDPVWLNYINVPNLLGAKAVTYGLKEETGFQLDLDEIRAKISPKTRAVVIVTPNNPTGGVLAEDVLKELAEIAIQNDLMVISDEIYERLVYDGVKHISIASLPGMKERTFTMNGMSKAYAMDGWRLGYVAAPEEYILAINKFHQHNTTCAPNFVQVAAIAALMQEGDEVKEMVKEYQRRRDYAVKAINGIPGISCQCPKGAFYIFINCKSLGMKSTDLSAYLLENAKIALVPGDVFGPGGEGYLRMSFANSYESLAVKTFIGFGLGIVIGLIFGEKATVLKPLGTIFLNMIKMIVVPMVFFSITAGVASLGDLRKLRSIGVKVVGLYALTSAISVLIGFLVANVTNPGKGFDMSALVGGTEYEAQEMPSVLDTIIDAFPSNVFNSFANANMLQIIVFSIFLGVALIMLEEKGQRLSSAIQGLADVMYKITAIVMEFSPIGVCALLADSVGAYGLEIFGPLGKLILTVYASDVILVCLMYVPMVALLARFPIGQFFKGIWKVWVVTLSTTSSSGSLPVTTSVTNDDFGVSPELSSFSLPLGATINMNGGCIYYAAAIVMTAQIYGMELTPAALVNIVVSTVLVAMGCPGVPGGAIIMTTILLTNMGLPLEIVGMIAGIFRLIDMANTTFNVTGDVVTTMVVARSENMLTPPTAVAAKK